MLRKKIRKHPLPDAEVNVIPLMDILTTLLFFLIIVSSMANFSILKGSGLPPVSSDNAPGKKKPVFTLQVVIKSSKFALVWLGPIKGLKSTNVSVLSRHLSRKFVGNPTSGFLIRLKARNLKSLMIKNNKTVITSKRAVILTVPSGNFRRDFVE